MGQMHQFIRETVIINWNDFSFNFYYLGNLTPWISALCLQK